MSASASAVQSVWARLIARGLADAGVAAVIVSPGSRSTPLALAVADGDALPVHVVIDERAAGFVGLGLARASGRPAAVLCTSGTAAAHYFPAIIEAAQARVPLIAITADRPPELQGCAAPQTIDQTRLYGGFVRAFVDLGPADGAELSLRALRRRVAQAVAASLDPEPGPVQINVPLRKPLELDAAAALPPGAPARVAPARRLVDDATIAALAARIAETRRGVIAAGPIAVSAAADGALAAAAHRLAAVAGFPLCAEATSQLRFTTRRGAATAIDGFDLVLADAGRRAALAPSLVIELGAPPTSGAWAELLAGHPCERWSIAAHGWNDPTSSVALHVVGDITDALTRLADAVAATAPPTDHAWLEAWRRADAAAWSAVERELGHGAAAEPPGELAAVAAAIGALPPGALLTVGNSLPVRTIDTCCRGRRDLAVIGQRGANGIDGLVAGAAGAALAPGDGPTALLVGDVSFAHDLGGLAAARLARRPLVLIVVDNAGGRLFEQLPIAGAATAAQLERLWLTPPRLDVAAAAAAFGITHAAPRTVDAIADAVRAACARPGATLVHLQVAPTSAAEARGRLRAAMSVCP